MKGFAETLPPGSFLTAVNPEQPRTWTELMYLAAVVSRLIGLTLIRRDSDADA